MSSISILPVPAFRPVALALLPLALLLGLSGCQTTAPTAPATSAGVALPDIPGLASYDYAASLDPLKALDNAVAKAGKDPAQAAALAAGLTELMRDPKTTFAARQAICERLGHLLINADGSAITGSHPTLALLGPWLDDAKLAPLALIALERVPSPAIDSLLQAAAQRASGPSRTALDRCLERRRYTAPAAVPVTASVAALVADLGGADLAKKESALQQLARLKADAVAAAIAPQLGSWDADTQRSGLTLLGRMGHSGAVPTALAATRHAESSVRLVALTTLGHLPGTADGARRLLDVVGGTAVDESKAALAALGRLNGPGLNELLLAGARQGNAPARVSCLRALAARYTLEAVPLAYQLQKDSEATVRAAALDLLSEIAPFAEQPAVLAWTLKLTDDDELARAQRALVAITQRAPQPAEGIRVILAAIEKAEPAVQVRQMRMLPRLGDADSLACVKRLAASKDSAVAKAAKSAQDRWPKEKEKEKGK